MVILVLHDLVVCKNSPCFENFLPNMDMLQNSPYKMQIRTKSE